MSRSVARTTRTRPLPHRRHQPPQKLPTTPPRRRSFARSPAPPHRKRKPMPAVPTIDAKPFYAYVGAGDAAIESLRTAVITLPEAFKSVPEQLKTVPASLKAAREQFPTQVKELQGTIAQLPLLASSLPAQVKELQATFEKRYDEYATRGEKVLAELRGGKAKSTATPAAKPAAKPAAAKKPAAKKAAPKPAVTATNPVVAESLGTPTPTVPA